MAKKKAPAAKHVIPGNCGPLVDYILGIMEEGQDFDLAEACGDFKALADFLADLPGDAQPWQMDLSEFSFTSEAEKIIKAYMARAPAAHEPQRTEQRPGPGRWSG